MYLIRYILGRVILFVDWLTTPKSLVRSENDQKQVDARLRQYRIYELKACPFCVKVRREAKRLGLNITTLNVKSDVVAKQELESEAGKYQVPCLRINNDKGQSQWIYESDNIITLLRQEFLPAD